MHLWEVTPGGEGGGERSEWARRDCPSPLGAQPAGHCQHASELVLPPPAGTSYSSTCSNFTATFQVPSRSQHCLVKQMPWPVPSLLPPPLSQPSFLLPWAALKLSTPPTEVPFFSLISFSLKARLSYHQNHSQMTGFNGLTRHVSSYLLGDKSETARLKWKCTFAQVRAAPTGCSHVFTGLALPPMPSAVRSHVPVPFVHLP